MFREMAALAMTILSGIQMQSQTHFWQPEKPPHVVSPLPKTKLVARQLRIPTVTPTPTNTPTPTPSPTDTPTPTPTATPTPQPAAPTDLESLFQTYSSHYSIDKSLLEKIAACESGMNPNASYQDLYKGMFQFSEQSWTTARLAMNADPNPDLRTNAEEAIKTAAFMLSLGEQNAWPACSK